MNLPDEVIEKAAAIADCAYRKGREDALTEARAAIDGLRVGARPVMYEGQAGLDAAHNKALRKATDALTSLAGEKEKGCPYCNNTGKETK